MLFNSLEFLIFFPIVISAYFLTPSRYRWILLLIASYYFYMCWKAEYIVLIAISTLTDYFAGLQIAKTHNKKRKKLFLGLSIIVNIGLLASFKYANFFGRNLNLLFDKWNVLSEIPYFDVLLPVGISFYTFQTLSYTIDLYNDRIKPEKHVGIFAVYVSFFPQLVAGPIERAGRLIPQLKKKVHFDYERVRNGLLLMLWGFFKKMVIADRLAEYVNQVYNQPFDHTGLQQLIGTYFFSFQIYCDFSGYSDIAIGIAMIMGINLMNNFKRPYFAQDIREFWKRWHISLSTWFRDYVYIPLGGNKVMKWRWYYNIMATFVISGLWHGANWTFIIWGAIHGFIFIITAMVKKHGVIKKNLFTILINFHIVVLAWIFFRANSLQEASFILKNIFTGSYSLENANVFTFNIDMLLSVIFIIVLIIVDFIQEKSGIRNVLFGLKRIYRWALFILAVAMIILFGEFKEVDFLYFQF